MTYMRWISLLCAMQTGLNCAGSYGPQSIFVTPDQAARALLASLESGDYPQFLRIAGSQMAGFWNTGDSEADGWNRERYEEAIRKYGILPDPETGNLRMIAVDSSEEPFPAPLVRTDGGWRFDGEVGGREVVRRRIHRNEIAAAELCQRFREAEYTYFALDQAGDHRYALRIRSSPGQHDGLFWTDGGEDESPMGPPFAAAAFGERQSLDGTRPLFGYYFKILAAQGPNVAGGALDYRAKGVLRKGFALIAWPAEYGVDGARTFLINHFGDIYEKDLGADTTRVAESTTRFNPDRTWTKFNAVD